jgi:mannosyl-oligosaccharide glucosidase
MNMPSDKKVYDRDKAIISQNIETLHWSKEERAFCDATIDANGKKQMHACFKGYVSLMPFLVGLLEVDNAHVESILDMVHDRNELWSSHGVRSLSKNSALYGAGENYWKGPVWLNMNFLLLERLMVSNLLILLLRLPVVGCGACPAGCACMLGVTDHKP